MVAVDALNGKKVWESGRDTGASRENEHSYSSPMLYDFNGVTFLITHGGDYTIAYNLEDGSERWRLGGLNPQGAEYHPRCVLASPAANDGLVICPTAKTDLSSRFAGSTRRPDGQRCDSMGAGNESPDVPSPIIHDGLVYLCRENGFMLVLDQATGDEVYMERSIVIAIVLPPCWRTVISTCCVMVW